VSGIWTLCELWKKRIMRWIPIILVWRFLEKMEGRDILYEIIKGNVKGCGKVVGLLAFSSSSSFALHSF